jgi:antitoxin VapB
MITPRETMPLYVKDREVDRLAKRLALLRKTTKTAVVRQALERELEREEAASSLVEKGMAFVKALHARSHSLQEATAYKDFIDGLYEKS